MTDEGRFEKSMKTVARILTLYQPEVDRKSSALMAGNCFISHVPDYKHG